MIKLRILSVLAACLLLVSCTGQPDLPAGADLSEPPRPAETPSQAVSGESQGADEASPPESEPDEWEAPAGQPPGEEEPSPEDAAFLAQLDALTYRMEQAPQPEEVIQIYLELQYLGYSYLQTVDLGLVLDLDDELMQNLDIWLDLLTQRRRLLSDTELCYVEREQFDFEINYIAPEELSDQRLEFWEDYDFGDNGEGLEFHFVVTGEAGKAYPPLMALNSQHTVRLRPTAQGWKINFHYFPGAARKFYRNYLDNVDDSQAVEALFSEFEQAQGRTAEGPRQGSTPYRGVFAARYASRYAEAPNEDYYHVGDWSGNCMNFVSQCVLHGFGDGTIPDSSLSRFMTGDWFSGGGGGTLAWENVDYFWYFATQEGPLRAQVLEGAGGLRMGDVVQTRSSYLGENDDPDDFSHCLIVVEPNTMLLAQNSPANFVYYSDLVYTEKRYVRPLYMD